MSGFSSPHRITGDHVTNGFSCGQPSLDDWVQRFALMNDRAGMSTCWVSTKVDSVELAGFYALSAGAIAHEEAPQRVAAGVARHPIPVIILTRLAVHELHQGRGLGRCLLQDALLRVANAADEIGIRALLIHAKDSAARDFYQAQAEFEPSPIDEMQLFLLMKDLRKSLAQ